MSKDKKSSGLTAHAKMFCRLIAVEGMKQGPAYAQAFGCKGNSAGTLAGRLLKKVEVQREIQRLSTRAQQVAEAASLWSKAERMERLQEWAERSAEAGEINAAVRCVDVLNKMDGAYEPQKLEVSTDADMLRAILSRTNAEPMVRDEPTPSRF